MSDEQHEPSYYEIALTGRQVTGAFVVVLVCLLVAFFAGVWIGRGAPREALADTGREAPAPTPAPKDELSFFADRGTAQSEPKPAEPKPVEPKPMPVTPPPAVTSPPVPAPGAEEPATRPEPKPEAPRPDPPKPEVSKPETPKPEPARVEPPKPPPPTASPAATGPLVIQVFTSSDEAKAKDMLKKVKAKGFKAYLSPTKANGKTVYRVRVGPFAKEADAKATSDKIEKQLKVDTWITRSP